MTLLTPVRLNQMKSRKQFFLLFTAGLLIATFLDQYTKKLAVDHLMGKAPIVLIPGVFELR